VPLTLRKSTEEDTPLLAFFSNYARTAAKVVTGRMLSIVNTVCSIWWNGSSGMESLP
jgi:hypothetical protein